MAKKFISDAEMNELEGLKSASSTPKFISDSEMSSIESSSPSKTETAIRQGLGGALAGFDDELIGYIGAAGRVAGFKNLGSFKPFDPNSKLEFDSPTLDAQELKDAYRRNRDDIRMQQAQDIETNPKTALAANILGGVLSPVSKIKLAGGSKLATAIKSGAAQGAAFGLGSSLSDLTEGDFSGAAKDVLVGAGTGAAVPYAFDKGGAIVKKAASAGSNAAGYVGKKALSGFLGVSEDNATKYLKRSAEINAAPEISAIKNSVDDAVNSIRSQIDDGKINVNQAKDALKDLKNELKNRFSDAKLDARESVRKADELLKESTEKAFRPLKEIKAPTDRAADATELVSKLKKQVSEKSSAAREVLNQAEGEIDLKKALDEIKFQAAELRKRGTLESEKQAQRIEAYGENLKRVTSGAKKTTFNPSSLPESTDFNFGANEVPARFDSTKVRLTGKAAGPTQNLKYVSSKALKNNLESGYNADTGFEFDPEEALRVLSSRGDRAGDALIKSQEKQLAQKLAENPTIEEISNYFKVSPSRAKELIQGLDDITEYDLSAGSFEKGLNKSYKAIRRKLDETVKDSVPAYRERMAEVSRDVGLLDDANQSFGRPEIAVSKLGRMNTPRGKFDLETLMRLEDAVGTPGAISSEAKRFEAAQSFLKDPKRVEELKSSLPEFKQYQDAVRKLAKMRPDWSRNQIEKALSGSKEARALDAAQSRLSSLESRIAPFSSITESNSQSKLESFIKPKGASIETIKALQALEKDSGKKFIQDLDDRAVLDAFSKPYANGSRNTVLWGVVGAMVGGLPGGSAGAIYGRVVDQYGPKIGKSILDGIIKVRDNPSVKAIQSLDIPQNIKDEMAREFRLYIQAAESGSALRNKVASGDLKGEDKWAMSGAEKLGLDRTLASELMASPKSRKLLIEVSDLKPGSKRFEAIKKQLSQGLEK